MWHFLAFSCEIYLEEKQWYTDIHLVENYENCEPEFKSKLNPTSPSILTTNEAMFLYKADKKMEKM